MEQNFYLSKLLGLKDNFSVKIISGVRGVGKTTLLKAFAEELRAEGVADEEIIFVDCAADERLKNFQAFYEFVEAKTAELEKFFLLADEMDCVVEGEKALNALFVGMPAEIYVTASSESFVEKISALLPDNCDVLKVYPLSFSECEKIFPSEDALKNYLLFGGLPEVLGADEKFLPRLVRGLTYEIIFDLVEKNSLARAETFRKILMALAQNVGKPFNFNRVPEILGDVNYTPSNKKYFKHCAALFRKIPRFDLKTKTFLKGAEKFYCVDNGILRALGQVDENILIENAVCIELLRRGYSVSNGKFGSMNVTFVAERGAEKIFVQVPATSGISIRRNVRPLRELTDDGKKILIPSKREKKFDGVTNIILRDFLTNV